MEQHRHMPVTYHPGWIYCVRDKGSQSNQVKCGKTKQDPTKYCRETYGRHMGETIVLALCRVSDITFAEGLLFDLLDKYRLYKRREVFEVPDLSLIDVAFQALVDSINTMGKVYPERFSAEICKSIHTVVIETRRENVEREKEERRKLREELYRMKQEDVTSKILREKERLTDCLQKFIDLHCEVGKMYFMPYSDIAPLYREFTGEEVDPKQLSHMMDAKGFIKGRQGQAGTRGFKGLRLKC